MDLLRHGARRAAHLADDRHQRADDQGHARAHRRRGARLSAIDKARPEVIIDVELLEVDRTRLQEYGLQFASPGSPGLNGIDGTVPIATDADRTHQPAGAAQPDAVRPAAGQPAGALLPAAQDRHEHAHARQPAAAHVGRHAGAGAIRRTVPVPVTTFAPIATGGTPQQPITSFNYENIGVNIDITPRTHHDDDVSLTLKIAVHEHLGHAASAGCRRSAIARSTP